MSSEGREKIMNNDTALILTDQFKEQVASFKEAMRKQYRDISNEITPEVDGSGQKIVKKRPDGKDYIEERYMRACLDKHFPGWSWEMAAPAHFLGSEWVVAQGHLSIIDEHLIALGVVPPIRKFYGMDAVRIQYKQNTPHTPENIIDVGDNVQSANAGAFKRAVNRLTHIGDDIYNKRVDWEGAGTFEDVIDAQVELGGVVGLTAFNRYVSEHKLSVSKVIAIVGPLSQIRNPAEALAKVKQARTEGKL